MAKFYGPVGYSISTEIRPGVWKDQVVEHWYQGDVSNHHYRNTPSDQVNQDLTVESEISIVSDLFAIHNFSRIRYVKWMGVPWTVMKVEVEHPRLRLRIGGVYNGETLAASE